MKKSILMFAVFAMSLVAMSWTVTGESTLDRYRREHVRQVWR